MSYGDVFTRINREYYQLTGAERKIADHIMLRRQDCQYLSISELAEEAEVAEATVSRFCRRLGYKGYSAFKLAVAGAAAVSHASSLIYSESAVQDEVAGMCRRLCEVDVAAISQTMELLDPDAVSAAADLVLAADRVLCMGLEGSTLQAREAARLFSTVLPNVYPVDDPWLQVIRCATLRHGDLVVYFSSSGSARDLADVVNSVRERGARIILITCLPQAPGAALADVVLECGVQEGPLRLGSAAARMSQMFLTDVLFHEVCRRDAEGCRERRRLVAEALAEKRR